MTTEWYCNNMLGEICDANLAGRCSGQFITLTHWGRVMHICISKLIIIGSENDLEPGRRQPIIWTNAGVLLVRTSETHASEILSKTHKFPFKRMHLKMSSVKWWQFCLDLKVIKRSVRFTLDWIYNWSICISTLNAALCVLWVNPN